MSAGFIQLAAIGQQDVHLTGSPDLTYFSSVYKRHTPFVLESFEVPFLGNRVNYGQNNICRIPEKGDLIRAVTLKMILPSLATYGTDWYWPTPPTVTYVPFVVIDGVTYTGPTAGFQYYSSLNVSIWLSTFFGGKISYNASTNKFVFVATTSVQVKNSANADGAVFWGFDPRNFASTSGTNLVYNAVGGQVNPDFTLEQAGWTRSSGLPVDPLTGFFGTLNQTYSVGVGQQYVKLNATNILGPVWSQQDKDRSSTYTITTGGRLKFRNTGLYMIRANFQVNNGSFQTIAFGSDTSDGPVITSPIYFEQTYSPTVSPDPSTPITFPLLVASSANTYYFYITTSSGQLAANSYISVNPVEDFYKLKNEVTVSSVSSARIPFYSNVVTTGSVGTILNTDHSFTFTTKGQWLVSAMFNVKDSVYPYISNVFIGESANNIYAYDMSSQLRNPTYSIYMPIIVTDTAAKYHINVSSLNSTSAPTLNSASFVAFSYLGLPNGGLPGYTNGGRILPWNGLLYQPSSNLLTTPLNFNSNFTSNGVPYILQTTTTGAIQVSNVGTYMLTSVIQSDDTVSSITVSNAQYGVSTTYPVGVGLQPPYSINVPFRANVSPMSFSVSVGTVGYKPTAMNLYSNTFMWVYPVASNVGELPLSSYTYYDSVGTFAIQSADLKIGGQTIQSLSGEYIEIWNDLNVPYENQVGLTLMTGKNDSTIAQYPPPGRTYYVNLPYYFYNNPDLYLPLTAVSRQDVEIHVTFRQFNALTGVASFISVVNQTLQASLIIEYVYISEPEINWFKGTRLDYIISQCQYQTIPIDQGFRQGVFPMLFRNPVKELFFVIQPTVNNPYDYSNNGLSSLGMSFNGEEILSARITDATQLSVIEPFNKYQTLPTRTFFMKCWATDPAQSKPSGHINFSRLRQVLLTLNMFRSDGYYPAKELRIIAVNYNILRVADGLAGLEFNSS